MKQPKATKSVCNTLAIAIYDVEYGIDDHVRVRYVGIGYQLEMPQKIEKRLIRYDEAGNPYFMFHGNKEYLDEYMRV